MAKTKNSLILPVALTNIGLCIGAFGMFAAIEADFWTGSTVSDWITRSSNSYAPRSDLDVLDISARVQATLTQQARDVSVRPSDDLLVKDNAIPVRLVISSIGVDASVEAVGLEPTETISKTSNNTSASESTVAVPGRTEAGWYSYGSSPGQSGATVLAGHVDFGGERGVFWDLDELESGTVIEVHLSDGSIAKYRTMRGTDFSRDNLPSAELFRETGAPALHLITCGGAFNRNLGRYESNYVVTAAPIYDNA